MMTNTSMTIYNRYVDPITRLDKWQKHNLNFVYWDASHGVSISKGMSQDSKLDVYIPRNMNYMTYYTDPMNFKLNPVGNWTIQNGDIIVKGTITDEITKASDLERKYNNVYTVQNITENFYGSPNMQHIYIRGA